MDAMRAFPGPFWRSAFRSAARWRACATVCMLLLLPASLLAETERALVEGKDWEPVPSGQSAAETDTIEVLEFFSYGCPHCSDINPLIKAWAAELPDDVSVERVPVTFGRAAWESLSRLFFALQFAGELDRLDQSVFDAVIKQRVNLYTDKAILKWIAEQDVDAAEFGELLDSFGVQAALARANTLAARYQVSAVPRIIVDGRYQVIGKGARGKQDLLDIADLLIEKARASRAESAANAAPAAP